jgi:glycosyltransferase involved in cell wall biosynthesis
VYIGRLVRWKRVDDVLRVLGELGDTTLSIVGSGPEEARLRGLVVELGLEERVELHGAVPAGETSRLLHESGVLVLPSSYEGMPHVVLEAFAAGVPVVASDAGGTPELVEHGVSGLLYPCGQLRGLRRAIETALRPEVGLRIAAGGAEVARQLTVEAMARSTRDVLQEVLP